jgi:hypothetical protein
MRKHETHLVGRQVERRWRGQYETSEIRTGRHISGVGAAIVLGLHLGEALIIRNAGGRVTQAVMDDVAHLAFLTEQLFGGRDEAETVFEVAVVHHTKCANWPFGGSQLPASGRRRYRPLRSNTRSLGCD